MNLTELPVENQARPGSEEGLGELHVKIINYNLISPNIKSY